MTLACGTGDAGGDVAQAGLALLALPHVAACSARAGHRFVPSVFRLGLEVCERCESSRAVTSVDQAVDRVVSVLGSYRHRGVDEKQIQESVGRVLADAGLAFRREYALSPKDRPDFLVAGGVVIEVKMKASRSMVLMQLGRYASQPATAALVLASPRTTVVAGLPEHIHGKPVVGVRLPGPGLS